MTGNTPLVSALNGEMVLGYSWSVLCPHARQFFEKQSANHNQAKLSTENRLSMKYRQTSISDEFSKSPSSVFFLLFHLIFHFFKLFLQTCFALGRTTFT
jgi:hypothetical protein